MRIFLIIQDIEDERKVQVKELGNNDSVRRYLFKRIMLEIGMISLNKIIEEITC